MNFWIFLTNHSGLPYELFFLTLSLLFYFYGKFRRASDIWPIFKQIIIIIIAFGLFRLIGEFLKNGIAAPRTCWDPAYPTLVHCPDSFSFPSGHALGAFMLAIFISFIFKNKLISLISLTLALLVALSRYFAGVHTFLDISVGSLLGVIFGFLLWKFYWKEPTKNSK